MFYYFEGRYKKLIFLQFWNWKKLKFWNCKKLNFMKRFYKSTFLQFQNCKKIAYGNGDFIFHNFTATVTATVWKKTTFTYSFKTKKKN